MKTLLWMAAILAAVLMLGTALRGCSIAGNGDTLVIAVESAPKSLDPRLGSTDAVAARVHQIVFDTLVRKNERFEIVPYLAESFVQSPDARTFTFVLRRGVKFHGGPELTSADVKYTFDTIRDPKLASPVRSAFARIESIDTPDPYTVVFHCREPYFTLLGDLVAIGIIRDGTSATQAETPEGTGPFKVVRQEEQYVDLEPHADYFNGPPTLQRLRIRVVADNNTRELEMKTRGIDLAINTGFSPDAVTNMRSDEELQVVVGPGSNIAHIGINTEDEILRNPEVRRALALGIDRDQIITTLLQGQARPADAIMPPESWAYEQRIAKYPHDLAAAKAALDRAGYPDPDGDGPLPRFTTSFTTSNVGQAPAIGQIIQEQLKLVGIAVTLEQFERNTFFQRLNTGNFDMYYAISVGGNQTPDVFGWAYHSRYQSKELDDAAGRVRASQDPTAVQADLAKMLEVLGRGEFCPSSEADRLIAAAKAAADPAARRSALLQAYDIVAGRGAGNRGRYCDPEINDKILAAERSADREEQKRLYSEIQMKVAEMAPQLYLWYPANVVVATQRVGNINIDASGAWYFVKDVTLAK